MRTPYGSMTELALKTIIGLGYKIVFWNFATRDWALVNKPDLLLKNAA